MSDTYGMGAPGGARPDTEASDHRNEQQGPASGKADAAKEQAADLKDTVTDEAAGVVGTAKDEARSVAHEAKSQAKDLFAQTTDELSSQMHNQQQRLSGGLRSAGAEMRSMADSSEQGGVASEIVRELSHRVEGVGDWLGDRTPSSVLREVKQYARRKPGTFILLAAVAGVAVGRLSRALASGASESGSSGTSGHLHGASASGRGDRSTAAASAPLVSGTTADTAIGTGADVRGGTGIASGPGTATGSGTTTGLGTGADAFPAAPDGIGGAATTAPGTPLYDQVAAPRTDRTLNGGDDDRSDTL